MYDIQDMTRSMNEDRWTGDWLSVIHNMVCYRVHHGEGRVYQVWTQDMQTVNGEEAEEILQATNNYLKENGNG